MRDKNIPCQIIMITNKKNLCKEFQEFLSDSPLLIRFQTMTFLYRERVNEKSMQQMRVRHFRAYIWKEFKVACIQYMQEFPKHDDAKGYHNSLCILLIVSDDIKCKTSSTIRGL